MNAGVLPQPTPDQVDVGGVKLTLWRLDHADPARPLAVLLHGMRDVGRSLLPIARTLAADFNVAILDQRGHGDSDYPGAYSIEHFYYDLYQVIAHLQAATPQRPLALIGHSLGGQIAARYAGLFAEQVQALLLVEGLGPPDPTWPQVQADYWQDIDRYRKLVLERFSLPRRLRALPDLDFAVQRLRHNNPRLSDSRAREIVGVATHRVSVDGQQELHWAFDPRVASAFVGFSEASSQRLWQAVTAPVLTITGDLAEEYWRGAMLYDGNYSGRFAPGEYEARISHFKHIEHERFDGSGHMVHFDEPARLADRAATFLKATLPG